MYHLAALLPALRGRRLPFTRDQGMLLMAALNEFFLGLDTYLAHVLNGQILAREWIPILFGPTAAVLLLVAGVIAFRRRKVAAALATAVLLASIGVGVLGAGFHLLRGASPDAAAGQQISLVMLIWSPPILAPLAFALVGLLGMSAAWVESPADSGTLLLPFGWRIHLPYSKTRAYFFMVSMGTLVALISSTLDHARNPWTNMAFWFPVVLGVLGVVAAVGIGAMERPSRLDVAVYASAMLFLLVLGGLGAFFHIRADLNHQTAVIPERFLRGAPFLAPMLFANMGLIGLIALLDPAEQ